ncbi:MAG: HsdR family type I site-specific deoxyribonuclease [Scytolyngbya sp. HA4215-MV1]|nr:HsdR family type I site-specific deoxyribonuclease [Scytolyngbya sp. HA4215-MV1]
MSFNEDRTVEQPILEHLQKPELGWRYENRDAVQQKYRANLDEVLLLPILRQKLKDLNPGVITSDERANIVINRLRALQDNQEWLKWLRNEKTMQFAADEQYQTITLIDYDTDPLNRNDFLVTNQFPIEGKTPRRPDVLLFINGIPIVNIEAKTATRGKIKWEEGAKQTRTYTEEIPQLYYSNAFCIGVNENRMKYGVPGTKVQYWQQWRDPSPHTHIDTFDEMNCSLYGLLDRRNLLDIIQNFIVFEVEKGKTVKKIARYQQFRAANQIVARAIALDQPSNKRRGVVWHTQGSGKSLTILFAALKLWNHPQMTQPTILVVIDRNQLQDQMMGQFLNTHTEYCTQADSIANLCTLLRQDYRGIIVTIINKFSGMEERITERKNVIVLADEAHRTQDGDLGIFMRAAIPNAARFGLTGTPLELDDRNTPKSFGQEVAPEQYERYMGQPYLVQDAIADGAIVPIHFKPRLSDWTIWGEDLDQKFAALFADRSEQEQAELKKQGAKLKTILEHPKRIQPIAEDIANHFQTHVRPNGFKAMLVCYEKDTCALYKAALDELLGAEVTQVIVSEDPSRDSEAVKAHYLGEAQRKKAIEDFKYPCPTDPTELAKPENRFRRVEILIVCDMLLTGFDAPILQTMYLDKGLTNHTLLQAIARVNRLYTELKQHGLIIDYYGVFKHLNDALSNFNHDELSPAEVAVPFNRFFEQFQAAISALSALFEGVDRSGSRDSLMQVLIALNNDEAAREQFEVGFRNIRILYEALQPDEQLRPYLNEYTWLCKLHTVYRKKFYPKEPFELDEEDGAKTLELVREHIDIGALEQDFPTYVLDANYLTVIQELPPNAKALEIESRLAAELKILVEEDEDACLLSERLESLIQRRREQNQASLELLGELEALAQQTVEIVEQKNRPVADTIMNLVKERVPNLSDAEAIAVVNAILNKAEALCFPNWFQQTHMDSELYREFTLLLAERYQNLSLHGKSKDFVDRSIKVLKKVRFCADTQAP